MMNVVKPLALLAVLALGASSSSATAQETVEPGSDVVLATLEAPMTREALNATRIALEEAGHTFHYGGFQFRPDGQMIGAEILLKIEGGVEERRYIEFVTDDCKLQILQNEGLKLEGC
mgnify:CR=1 FL=1